MFLVCCIRILYIFKHQHKTINTRNNIQNTYLLYQSSFFIKPSIASIIAMITIMSFLLQNIGLYHLYLQQSMFFSCKKNMGSQISGKFHYLYYIQFFSRLVLQFASITVGSITIVQIFDSGYHSGKLLEVPLDV